jgi:hypothetical protein
VNPRCRRRDKPSAVPESLGLGALFWLAVGCGEPQVAADAPGRPRAELFWGREYRLEANDAAELDQFGYSVSLVERRALVGAYGESLYRGAAYVYARDAAGWIHEQKLFAGDGVEGDSFGWSVSLDGDRLLVGAYAHDAGRGAAYVFVRNGNEWIEEQKLVAGDGVEGDQFGWSVSLSRDRALVGAFARESSRGAAYVFRLSGGAWVEEQTLVLSQGREGDMLGYSVSLHESLALVGSLGRAEMRGSASLFTVDGGAWAETTELVASDGAAGDQFGVAVSLVPPRALVGAYSDDEYVGAAYLFSESDGTFLEEQKLTASDGAPGHRFGNAVSLGPDHALVATYSSDDARGAVYSFARLDGAFLERQKLVASDGLTSDFFGWSVALAEDGVLVGAHYDDVLRGAAYVYSLGPSEGGD